MSRFSLLAARPLYGLSWLWWSGNTPLDVENDHIKNANLDEARSEAKVKQSFAVSNLVNQYERGVSKTFVNPPSEYTKHFDNNSMMRCREKIDQSMLEHGIPGLVIGVSIKYKKAWSQGFGYCDVENLIPCNSESIMRIASISKSLTMSTAVAKLLEENKLDLLNSVHKYLDEAEFPKQKIDNTYYDINLKQLLSNTSGIRHYHKEDYPGSLTPMGGKKSRKAYRTQSEIDKTGPFLRSTYKNVIDSLELFKNDDLVSEPGTEFCYSTNGWTLVSAIVQKVLKNEENFEDFLMKLIRSELGMKNTYLDQEEPIIFHRSRYYTRNGISGRLMNAPSVDVSCKWAGGGLLSHTDDLLKLSNVLLYSYKGGKNSFLKSETVKTMWSPVVKVSEKESYGLGFFIGPNGRSSEPETKKSDLEQLRDSFESYVYHTGSAVGASSILVILPEEEIVIAIIANLHGLDLRDLAFSILKEIVSLHH